MKPLGIIELLTRIGEDKVMVQPMLESITNVQLADRGRESRVTFITGSHLINPNDLVNAKPANVPLILWLPSELVEKAKADHAAAVVIHPDDPGGPQNWNGGL